MVLVILLKRDITVYGIGDFVKKGHHCIMVMVILLKSDITV